MIARIAPVLAIAFVLFACASIDAPASFTPPDASTEPLVDAGAARRCGRILPRRFATDATARVYGDPSGPQAVCVSLTLEVPSANDGIVTFCVAGQDLGTASVGPPRDIGLSSKTCAYCIDVQTNCTGDAGTGVSCATAYAPVAGSVRIVRLGRRAGEEVWIDVGALVVARVDDPDAGILQPRDCLFADGLTFQGKLVAATCTDDGIECQIANSASSRFP